MDLSEVTKIRDQFKAGQWPLFLEMIEVKGLRGWTGQTVNFNFPVVAVVGENGTGKSTLLKVAACAYENKGTAKTFYPSSFFLKTKWDDVQGVALSYRIKQGTEIKNIKINKPSRRWSLPDIRPKRDVYVLDISRTLPLDASAGYAKIARLAATEISTSDIETEYRDRLSHILGRNYASARFATSDVDKKRDVGLLTREFGEISQFHQGAGEDTTLDLIRTLQSIPPYSLLIIDEIEASLHPRAQRRLVRFLLWFSRQKRVQVILSTHSPYVLEELPLEASVLLMPGPSGQSVVYGSTPDFALSRIDENVHPELFVFVEDREAVTWLREIIASDSRGPEILGRLIVFPVGPANVVKLLGQLSFEKRLPFGKSLAIIDGEQEEATGCFSLPGDEAPEITVFKDLKGANYQELPERFGVGAGALFTILDDAQLEPDHHKWTAMVGDKILKSSASVWDTLCTQWCKLGFRADGRKNLVDKVVEALG